MDQLYDKPEVVRNYSLDLIRLFAFFCVISLHFISLTGYYGVELAGQKLFIATIFRSFFRICVPLFIMLTGYLQNKKKFSVKYLMGIKRVLSTYLLASLFCYLYKSFYLNIKFNMIDAIGGVLNYKMADYSWYIEMYLSLFLLIPFLNTAWNYLTEKEKRIFLVILAGITFLPSIVNVYNFTESGWWREPALSEEYYKIIPFYFNRIYPITYYFLGCFLSECNFKLKKRHNLFLIGSITVTSALYCWWRSYGHPFIWGDWENLSSPFVVAIAVFTFIYFLNIKIERCPAIILRILEKLSGLCLGAFLVSAIFDNYYSRILTEHVDKVTDRFWYYIVVVPFVFVCSLLGSEIIDYLKSILRKIGRQFGKQKAIK